ncbi:argininosuccinate synthase [Thalassobacter stenotrophicus]|jgi:argininosuccinate synthase|uniref:Argininosuccinate synthase n=2 Tax=Thalassobacter stenotrophicus TaxID=266809 RepID=A0A0P1EX99_9RHOB|nr:MULTISPECIES: argininosuccinate synthase [Thalassobacter]KGK79532.1 argininosuccinate synthase [Thalassobacter stenotrophicus]KGL01527.1 argininosuccinate synthase [Thalassobacter sp. 16PALIMAR09]PVZ49831.1 argininosuccinate synthase [Thalassobacter stenotrophicus]UYP67981.1 argininosuccinate synthase [Thalassobacter stenotrophicus]CUH59719.1 Argininosuccinate synthase [Thalassobacter stenotrophicus]
MSAPKKVVLAYSGGLDTSIILKWLQTEYGCEVVTFTADLGQGEELEPARAKAELMGASSIYIEDLREEFVRDFVFPMFRANALYEGLYLLGTSIARPLISKRLVEIAAAEGADAVSHGATGKGNDQVRFELAAYALNPDIKVIAPWREWDLSSRTKLIDFAEKNQIPIAKDKRGEAPFSVDANLLHTSSEGKVLEDPAGEAPEYVYQRTVSPEQAPDTPEFVEIAFEKGDAVAINGVAMSPATVLTKLNELGGKHGIGRLDLVENRFVGMKSRGIYETPGGTILLEAHRGIEQITLDSGAGHLKDSIMPRYAELIYNGFWYSPEREMLQALIDKSQEHVTGTVKLKLYKGSAMTVARWSDHSLYSEAHVTFEEDAGAYDQADAAGFIHLNALRLKLVANRNKRVKG